jgi:eukaryotic-like serine/threonine-protein kinase
MASSPAMATSPNRLGKYDLIARIAKGGMAEIYLARQRGVVGFSRLVVIKRILPHLAEEPQFVRMFLEEARLAALINHPNVVQIFDVDHAEGNYYIAMEYLAGPSVSIISRQLRRSEQTMPYAVAAELVAQACDGLHAAHELHDEAGIPLALVHRDVSPHNLMITESGLVKLVDFGIAKAQNTTVQTRTGNIKGKYPYMSPEQCRGDILDRRTDLFSLGTVFFELVAGRRLFQRNTELMTLKAITEEPIPLARDVRPEVPEEVSNLIARCLRRDREERFATAAELAAAVRQTLAALSSPTSPTLLAGYLKRECGELLRTRAEAIKQASQIATQTRTESGSASVPLMEGLGSDSHASSASASIEASVPAVITRGGRRASRRMLLATLAGGIVGVGFSGGLLYRIARRRSRPPGIPLRFGLPPSFPPAVAQREMTGFLSYVERRIDRPVDLVVTQTYHALHAELISGQLDFAHMPPLQFLLAWHREPRVQLLATGLYEGARTYQALLVVRDDSPISSVAQAKGKRICYVDRESTSGYLLPRAHLRQQRFDPDTMFVEAHFSGTHIDVLREVISGRCDLGATYSGALAGAPASGLAVSRVRMLAPAGQVPYDVILATPSLPKELAAALRRALLEMDVERDLGRKIIGPSYRISGFTAVRLTDFQGIEAAARTERLL